MGTQDCQEKPCKKSGESLNIVRMVKPCHIHSVDSAYVWGLPSETHSQTWSVVKA